MVSLSWIQGVPAPAVNSLAGSAASAAISVAHHQHHMAHPENWIDEKGWAEIRMNQERAAEQKRQADASADYHRQQQRQMEQQRESNDWAQRQAAEESQRAYQRDAAAASQKAEADSRWAQMQAESARQSQAFLSSSAIPAYQYNSPQVQFHQPVFQPQPRIAEIVPAVPYVHTPIQPSFFPIFQPVHIFR